MPSKTPACAWCGRDLLKEPAAIMWTMIEVRGADRPTVGWCGSQRDCWAVDPIREVISAPMAEYSICVKREAIFSIMDRGEDRVLYLKAPTYAAARALS